MSASDEHIPLQSLSPGLYQVVFIYRGGDSVVVFPSLTLFLKVAPVVATRPTGVIGLCSLQKHRAGLCFALRMAAPRSKVPALACVQFKFEYIPS